MSKISKNNGYSTESAAFKLSSEYEPNGDQPQAIEEITNSFLNGQNQQVLLGVTGSGKTFTAAHIIQNLNKPTLILAPNKTLAAQLFSEFKDLFPENAVEYFVSYYDYYQPEAYVPTTDTFIEKDSAINDEIDKLRHSTTHSLLTRKDVIIVASVSCIYGIGSPDDYSNMNIYCERDMEYGRDKFLRDLISMQYMRNDNDFHRGSFRVRGDTVEVFPAYEGEKALRFEFFGETIDQISEIESLRGTVIRRLTKSIIHPASHFVTTGTNLKRAITDIRQELNEHLIEFKKENKQLEMARIEQRTLYDIEMLEEMGYCNGIENYSRHLSGRKEGEAPYTLIDYFPKDFLLIADESHIAIPQIGGMYKGDRSRKQTLVNYGFRMPSALDNRPLQFEEFKEKINDILYVSATPGTFEMESTGGVVTEQIIRPTGLLDPTVEVRPTATQVDDLLGEIKKRVAKNERVLVTTLTKRLSEELTNYYEEMGVKIKYLHSDIDTLERVEILRDLRLGVFDVLVGINLLREGLDLPEVTLVGILDADKEGFLRSERSLIQTFGRAARNVFGHVILYGDKITNSMEKAIGETTRRRKIQKSYNKKHGITPTTIKSKIKDILGSIYEEDYYTVPILKEEISEYKTGKDIHKKINELRAEMKEQSKKLNFEKCAVLRDEIKKLEMAELNS